MNSRRQSQVSSKRLSLVADTLSPSFLNEVPLTINEVADKLGLADTVTGAVLDPLAPPGRSTGTPADHSRGSKAPRSHHAAAAPPPKRRGARFPATDPATDASALNQSLTSGFGKASSIMSRAPPLPSIDKALSLLPASEEAIRRVNNTLLRTRINLALVAQAAAAAGGPGRSGASTPGESMLDSGGGGPATHTDHGGGGGPLAGFAAAARAAMQRRQSMAAAASVAAASAHERRPMSDPVFGGSAEPEHNASTRGPPRRRISQTPDAATRPIATEAVFQTQEYLRQHAKKLATMRAAAARHKMIASRMATSAMDLMEQEEEEEDGGSRDVFLVVPQTAASHQQQQQSRARSRRRTASNKSTGGEARARSASPWRAALLERALSPPPDQGQADVVEQPPPHSAPQPDLPPYDPEPDNDPEPVPLTWKAALHDPRNRVVAAGARTLRALSPLAPFDTPSAPPPTTMPKPRAPTSSRSAAAAHYHTSATSSPSPSPFGTPSSHSRGHSRAHSHSSSPSPSSAARRRRALAAETQQPSLWQRSSRTVRATVTFTILVLLGGVVFGLLYVSEVIAFPAQQARGSGGAKPRADTNSTTMGPTGAPAQLPGSPTPLGGMLGKLVTPVNDRILFGAHIWGDGAAWTPASPADWNARIGGGFNGSGFGAFALVDAADGIKNPVEFLAHADAVRTARGFLLVTLEPMQGLEMLTPAVIDKIAMLLATVNDRGIPILLRFAHEMNGNWYPWAQKPLGYKRAWIELARVVKARAKLTSLVWSPNAPVAKVVPAPGSEDFDALDTNRDGQVNGDDDPFSPYYPGDEWVDWISMSAFAFGPYPFGRNTMPEPTAVASALAQGKWSITSFARSHGTKPFGVFETAAAYHPSPIDQVNGAGTAAGRAFGRDMKLAWLAQLVSPAARRLGVALVMWFEFAKVEPNEGNIDRDFTLTRDPDVARAVRELVMSRTASAVVGLGP
ncbi:hypothetical protein H9P43_002060 [Blastocladiella emersonii ATCC 22665]|nr:hypothetical protein H9P43_002060 [Blastocladiella emersonii ATCC 22665]